MIRKSVISSNLRSVGFDSDTQVLEVEFHNGSVYRYSRVPANVYYGLLNAHSKGTYFDRVIRDYPLRYPYRKIH